ncbi:leucine-rich repeat protein [Dysgonomonas termitidis]|uniref:Leucine-rich repeat protein n=1 Tax=Dysgonomonas termitidis TaxID=1516126 RepID=A0ABV9KW08_9BACT
MKNQTNRRNNFMAAMLLLIALCIATAATAQTWNISDNSTSGNNVTATLSDGTLTIGGTGNMADFDVSAEGNAPWYNSRSAIQTVVIENGVTNIGNTAFRDCANLQWITISEGVKIIGVRAFENCTSLPAVTIPLSVLTIENNAFKNCIGLKSIANLSTIPQSINSNVFQGVTISSIYLATQKETTETYKTANIWKNFKYVEPYVDVDDYLTVGLDGTAYYYEYWDNNHSIIRRLTAYDGVKDVIKMVAEYNQEGIPERILSENIILLIDRNDENKFNIASIYGGEYRSVDNIEINFTTKSSVNVINVKAAASKAVSSILNGIIKHNSADYLLAENTTPSLIGLVTTLINISGIDKGMPDEVKAVYYSFTWAFSMVNMVTSCTSAFVTVVGGPVTWTVGVPLIAKCLWDIRSAYSATMQMGNALSNVDWSWTKVNTNCSVTTMLTGSTLIIGGCGALHASDINKYADRKNEITKVIIENGVTSIGSSAFSGCTGLTTLTLGSGLTSIGSRAFYGCENLSSALNIPAGVTSIGDYAFVNCKKIPSLVVPGSVASVGYDAFQNCVNMQTAKIEAKIIEGSAFSGCTGLTTLTLGSGLTSIGSSAFSGCTGLTTLTLGSGLTSIGSRAFSGCTKLGLMTVNATIPPTISSNTFSGVNTNIPVIVPSPNTYKAAQYWNLFTNFHELGWTPSDNADLSSLTVSQGTLSPGFNVNTTNYTVSVANAVSSIEISTTAAGSSATVTGTGIKQLNVGNNTFNIVVTAENGTTTKTYTVVVTRANPAVYSIGTSSSPSSGGTTSGSGSYTQGTSCTVRATANTGYDFVNWTENSSVVSTNAGYTFTVSAVRNLVANFKLKSYTVSVSANPSAYGMVSGGGNYNHGASRTVMATAKTGYSFANWTENGSVVSTNASYTFTVSAARNLVANFTDTPVVLSGFSLNNGDGIAIFRTVDLTYALSGGIPTHFMASERQDFSGASWRAYDLSALNYTFASDEAGTKTVYTKLKNSRGETAVRNDNIYYKPYHPVNLASFTPNNGLKSAAVRTISLNHVIGDGMPTLYSISENSQEVGQTWLPYNHELSYILSPGNGMKELFFAVSDGTSVSNTLSAKILLDEATIRLYPNPVKDILNIEFISGNPTPTIRVQVYSLAGAMLLEKDSGTPVFSIDLSPCPAGVLLVKVSDGTKTEIHRIIKQ